MTKIKVKNPVVDMQGDEMARVMWDWIKKDIIFPYLDMDLKTYDLGIKNRDETQDQVTIDAIQAVQKYGVGIKCATSIIQTNAEKEQYMDEYEVENIYPDSKDMIQKMLKSTIFRGPIILPKIRKFLPHWTNPIVVAYHSQNDLHGSVDFDIPVAGTLDAVFTDTNKKPNKYLVSEIQEKGVGLGTYTTDKTIEDFARNCFEYALMMKLPLALSVQSLSLKIYDTRFKNIFRDIYDKEYKILFRKSGLTYISSRPMDDMMSYAIRTQGGFVWAMKNDFGPTMSNLVGQGFGSLGLMTSIFMSYANKTMIADVSHTTILKDYEQHKAGKEVSSNPTASIFAWIRGLQRRGELDETEDVLQFTQSLEEAVVFTVESGIWTKDMAVLAGDSSQYVTTEEFIQAIRDRLDIIMG